MIRRRFLSLATAGISAIIAGTISAFAIISGLSPLRKTSRKVWRSIGRAEDFSIGTVSESLVPGAKAFPGGLNNQGVFVWRPTAAEIVVFSRNCTDLGCLLNHDAGSACFLCPCHGGVFAANGERLAGPPNRPMDRFDHRLRGGQLEIELTSVPVGL